LPIIALTIEVADAKPQQYEFPHAESLVLPTAFDIWA